MNRDDIIRMAREAGFTPQRDERLFVDMLERFAHLVYESVFRDANIAASRTILDAAVLEEREACAKVVEKFPYDCLGCLDDCAAAIRARSNP